MLSRTVIVALGMVVVLCGLSVMAALAEENSLPVDPARMNTVKEAVFKNCPQQRNLSHFSAKDPNYEENQQALQKPVSFPSVPELKMAFVNSRILILGDDNSYSVSGLDDPISTIYLANGDLALIELEGGNPSYHCKYAYPAQQLTKACFDSEEDKESFCFKPNQELLEYWKDYKCYLPDGAPCVNLD